MNYGMAAPYGVVANAPADVRAGFIRRVYSLFFLSVLVTVGVGCVCAQPAIAPVVLSAWLFLVIAAFVCILALHFARAVSGLNVLLLCLFAAIEGAIVGPALTLIDRAAPGIPLQAAVLTASVFGGLTLYAFTSRRDFSFLGGFLFVGLIALVVAGIVMMFVHSSLMATVYAFFGVLIFSGYVLYDTSAIMRQLGPNDAVIGAVSLYLDLLNLFWFILQLLLEFNRRD